MTVRRRRVFNYFRFPHSLVRGRTLVRNVNDIVDEQESFGDRASDWLAAKVGSWPFILGQSVLLTIWVILNVTAYITHWDPYPFILMNLVLSLQAAFTAPVIMMSQNRLSEMDRIEAHNDYQINLKTEEQVRLILATLDAQNLALEQIYEAIGARNTVRVEGEE